MKGIELAINKAVEGGWNYYGSASLTPPAKVFGPEGNWIGMTQTGKMHKFAILSDREFWKSLGKIEGWNDYHNKLAQIHYANGMLFGWEAVWHHFIEWLADGGMVDDFFDNLLTTPLGDNK